MIGVDRGAPPPALIRVRERELRRLRALRVQGEPPVIGARYNLVEVRRALYLAQGATCCYCEMPIRRKGTPVEHHRPKKRALRGRRRPKHGYAWLAWDWDNLFLACSGCNSSKGDHFPLSRRGGVLRWWAKPPGVERPLLVDPGREDPTRRIRFLRIAGRWTPIPRDGSARGRTTIRRLDLDADDLVEHYGAYVRREIEPRARRVEARMEAGDVNGVRRAWKRMKSRLFSPSAPFKALAFDVLDTRFPRQKRAVFKIALPRP